MTTPRVLQVGVGVPGTDGKAWRYPLDMRVETVRRSGSKPNTATATLYGLSEASKQFLEQPGLGLQVLAGEGVPGVLFVGDIPTKDGIVHKPDGRDVETVITAATGRRAYRDAMFNRHYAPPATLQQVLPDVLAALGLPTGYISPKLLPVTFPSGWGQCGRARNVLTKLLEPQGARWSMQNGAVQVLAAGESETGQAVVIAPYTGMIGSPQKKKKGGMEVKFRLAPDIWPGRVVNVVSRFLTGFFRVTEIKDLANSRATEWESTILGVPW